MPGPKGINKMIDLFKKVFRYILLHILKYILWVYERSVEEDPSSLEYVPDCLKTQGVFEIAIEKDPSSLEYVPDHLKIQRMCERAVEKDPSSLEYVPDHLKTHETCNEAVQKIPLLLALVLHHLQTQGMCSGAVQNMPSTLRFVSDHLKTQGMCNEAVRVRSWALKYIPDWFLTQQQLKIWHDDNEYWNDDEIIKWYEGYKKCKAQKGSIKEELAPIALHPLRRWDWCIPEYEKRNSEKLWGSF